jgi:superfamily II DNA or RNA helicase
MGQPTLIIVTKEDLIKGWRNTLINLVGINPSDIGHIQADKCSWKGKKFVIAMVHSLVIEDKYEPDMFQYFGMVIFDEVHRMGADTFSIAAGLFPAQYRLGLSATPLRKDGKDPLIKGHIGKTMVRGKVVPMSPKILVKKTGWKCPKTHYNVQTPNGWEHKYGVPPMLPGRLMGVYKLMAADLGRNNLITEFVASAYKAGRRIVLMADLLDDHLKPMFHLLAKAGIPGEDMGYYTSGIAEAQLEANANKRVVLATYKMCGEGTNYPDWDTLVMMTPHADVKQFIGRVMRKVEGKKTPVVLDLVDADSLFANYFLSREKQFYEVGAEIVRM